MKTDLAIVGSGLAGASLALALQHSGMQVALIEAKPLQKLDAKRTRPISLNVCSVNILKNLGLWQSLSADATPIKQVHVSEQGCFSAVRIDASDYDLDALGYVVPLHLLYNHLLEAIKNIANIKLLNPYRLQQLKQDETGVDLRFDNGKSLRANKVIAADGMQSTVRKLLHIAVKTQTSTEQAVIANLHADHHHIAYERFTKEGIIALLPQANKQCGLVWTSDKADALAALDDIAFLQKLQAHTGYKVGELSAVSKRIIQPLNVIIAEQQVKKHCVLLGNAAHTFYPIAAQGFNLSLRDMATLVDVLQHQQDLREYESKRSSAQFATTFFTQFLADVYASENHTVKCARRASLASLNKIPALRHRLANFAMGRVGTMPKLALSADFL